VRATFDFKGTKTTGEILAITGGLSRTRETKGQDVLKISEGRQLLQMAVNELNVKSTPPDPDITEEGE